LLFISFTIFWPPSKRTFAPFKIFYAPRLHGMFFCCGPGPALFGFARSTSQILFEGKKHKISLHRSIHTSLKNATFTFGFSGHFVRPQIKFGFGPKTSARLQLWFQ